MKGLQSSFPILYPNTLISHCFSSACGSLVVNHIHSTLFDDAALETAESRRYCLVWKIEREREENHICHLMPEWQIDSVHASSSCPLSSATQFLFCRGAEGVFKSITETKPCMWNLLLVISFTVWLQDRLLGALKEDGLQRLMTDFYSCEVSDKCPGTSSPLFASKWKVLKGVWTTKGCHSWSGHCTQIHQGWTLPPFKDLDKRANLALKAVS